MLEKLVGVIRYKRTCQGEAQMLLYDVAIAKESF